MGSFPSPFFSNPLFHTVLFAIFPRVSKFILFFSSFHEARDHPLNDLQLYVMHIHTLFFFVLLHSADRCIYIPREKRIKRGSEREGEKERNEVLRAYQHVNRRNVPVDDASASRGGSPEAILTLSIPFSFLPSPSRSRIFFSSPPLTRADHFFRFFFSYTIFFCWSSWMKNIG